MSSHLQFFKPLFLKEAENTPFYILLLNIQRATSYKPYAWVDNVQRKGKLSVTLTPYKGSPTPAEVRQALQDITGKEGATWFDLQQHLDTLACQMVQKRMTSLEDRRITYGSSPESIRDAVMVSRPCIDLPFIQAGLELAREGDYTDCLPYIGLSNDRPAAWDWSQWVPPAGLEPILRQFVTDRYPLALHRRNLKATTVPWNRFHDKRRTKSPRTQLKYLMEQVNAHAARTEDSYYIEHPFPLLGYTPESFARLPSDAQLSLVADCQTWFSVHTLITLGTHEGELREDWAEGADEVIPYCEEYTVQHGKVTPDGYAVVSTLAELAVYLQDL